MNVPQRIVDLVETFDRNVEVYKKNYNETQIRREFIDPFFTALGWDVANEKGYAPAYKDVIHEDAIKVAGSTKAPDYCFRIGGVRKFFLEAKKPSVDIKDDVHPAYQLRRYAWSAKLPLSILTDFEELAVYDCQIKPKHIDRPSTARIMYLTYKDYIDHWDQIAGIFAKESVLKGSFDKFAQAPKAKRGTTTVDVEFLKEIEQWRSILARTITMKNRSLSRLQINFAVQRTIDRILFLRMCEDRGIENYGQLLALVNGDGIYQRLCTVFTKADAKYNSGLFHFRSEPGRSEDPDELTLNINIDDSQLKWILKNLYYPQCPYEFSVLPPEILGNVYEQFLGKVIRVTPGHRAVIEEKPEVKKAGGVYYTPAYIVDYIVKNTVGRLLGNYDCHSRESGNPPRPKLKTPAQVANLRILDPACGSGSFLLAAYTYLLDYIRDWYVEHNPEKHTDKIYQGRAGQWFLTIAEKKRILLNNIFGVDIDSQAVEVTKLSLLLKVLEGESQETIGQVYKMFHERALPDLGNNIKCGNSLIGPDFFDNLKPKQQTTNNEQRTMNNELYQKINPFDWKSEFPDVFKQGGFHAVIGNPPWISLTGKFGASNYTKTEIEYMIHRFSGNTYMPNMYEYFVAQGLNLVAIGGYFGFIVPDRLGFNSQFIGLRNRIVNQTRILSLIYRVPFPGITADTLMFIFHRVGKVNPKLPIKIGEYAHEFLQIPQLEYKQDTTCTFRYYESVGAMKLIKNLESLPNIATLCSVCESTSGFGGKSNLITPTKVTPKQIKTIKGNSIDRYILKKCYWFDFKKQNITGRTTDRIKLGSKPKILLRKTGDSILATIDDSGMFPEQSLYFLFGNQSALDFKYLLGILNSTLITFYYQNKLITNRRSIAQLKKVHLDAIPIRTIDFDNPDEVKMHDKMVKLVERMLALHKKLAAAKVPDEKTKIQRQISATDKQIDNLTYELYGLTDEEISIVEGAGTIKPPSAEIAL